MDPKIAGLRISRGLQSVEGLLDQLLAQSGELLADVTRARVAVGESALTAQRPIARLSSMQQKLVEARADIVRAHADIAKISVGKKDIPTDCPKGIKAESKQEAA